MIDTIQTTDNRTQTADNPPYPPFSKGEYGGIIKHTAHNQKVTGTDVKNEISGAEQNKGLKKVVKDMEALFAYQLIKVMRETADSMSSDNKGLGNSTYMSLFDMEISKLFAERGLGLQGAMMRLIKINRELPIR